MSTETRAQDFTSNRNASDQFAGKWLRALATSNDEGLADAGAADPFALPRLHPGIGARVGGTASADSRRASTDRSRTGVTGAA